MWMSSQTQEIMKLRSFFKLLAGAVIAPKVVAGLRLVIAGIDPSFTDNGFRMFAADMPRWHWSGSRWVKIENANYQGVNPEYFEVEYQLDSSSKVSEG